MCSILSLWACTGEPIEPKDKCQFNSDCTLNEQCVSGECKPKPTDGGNKEIITTEQTPQEPADEPSVEPTTGEEDAGNSDDLPEITTTEEPTNTEENVTDNTNTESDTCQDGDTRPCYTGETGTKDKGVCKAGTQTCFAGFWDAYCEGEVLPSQEECNGQDDDCNGQVDDNPTGIDDACQVSGAKGPCAQGETTCKSGKIECVSSVTPKTEVCDNGIDDDCDGTIDGGTCTCTPNEKRECYNGPTGTEGVGSCNKGEQVCGSDKKWGACQNETLPQAEVCNGKDDDCDGELDESYPEKGTSCADKTQKGECQKAHTFAALANSSANRLSNQLLKRPVTTEKMMTVTVSSTIIPPAPVKQDRRGLVTQVLQEQTDTPHVSAENKHAHLVYGASVPAKSSHKSKNVTVRMTTVTARSMSHLATAEKPAKLDAKVSVKLVRTSA